MESIDNFDYFYKKIESPIITLRQLEYRKEVEQNKIIYSDNIEQYNNFTKLVAYLISNMGEKNNSIIYSRIFSKLLYDGYFSDDSYFVVTDQKEYLLDIKGFLGIDIINGVGCCRHISSFYQDVFGNIDMNGNALCCFEPDITEPYTHSDKLITGRTNHVVNLLKYNGLYYVYDPMRKSFYYFQDFIEMRPYLVDEKNYLNPPLYYRPYKEMIVFDSSYGDIVTNIITFINNCKNSANYVTSKEIFEIVADADNIYKKSNNMLKEFKIEAKQYTKHIIPDDRKLYF